MRKNAVLMKIVVVAIVFALMVVPVQAQEGPVFYGGIEFPLGDVSFADKVVSFNPGTDTVSPYNNPQSAIGTPNGCGENAVALGHGGILTVTFTNNYLIDVEGDDLYVFECGGAVEPFKVEISKDGSSWINLGTVSGQPTSIDIHGKVAPGDRFSYVRLTDAGGGSGHPYAGADIDAVGAIGAEERPDSDGDGVPDDIDECSGTPAGVAVDDKGCPPCVADFWCSPRTGVAPMRVECFDFSYELPVSWTWDFGDGTTSTEQNPVHIYTVPGRYVITLRVECASGVIDTLETYVDVELLTDEEECKADFLIEQNRCRFQFFDISQGDPVEWQWDFGDIFAGEGADTSTAQNPAYSYLYSSDNAPEGSYQVTLTIRCRDGNESSISKQVQCEKGNQSINCSWDAPPSCNQWNRSSTPDYAKVLFLTDPPGATIFIDEYSNPCTTPAVVQFLDEGRYNILVRKSDCDDLIDVIDVVHGGVYCREYTLRCSGPCVEQEPQRVTDLRGTMTTDPQGNLYVIDYGNGTVLLIGPDGTATTYASGIDRPRSPIFDDTGNLYVGSFNGNIYKISPTGEKIEVASNIWSPQGMGFDGAGNLYVAGGYDGKIHCIAPDGSKTTMDSGFAHPKHLAVYSNGNIYVVDSGGTLIVRITPEGGKTSLVDLGETILGMATDGEYLYVSHADKISRIDTSGQVTHIATDLDQPTHLTVCNGSVFVTVSDGIVKLKISPVSGALKISDLRGFLNTDNDCNLYVADWGDNQVKMINPNGSTTSYASGIDRPRYQVFDSAGNLYVGSFDGNIYKVSASGGKTVVASGIWSPQGMGFDSAGNLYVAGGYDGKIHRIAPDGSKTTMDSGFAHPKHLAVYSDGNIYVVDSGGTLIVMITPEGGKTSLVDLGEPISGMATDGEYLYVSHSDKISRIDTSGQVTQIATDLDQPTHLTVCNGSVFVTVSDGIVKLKISDETKTGTCDWTGAWETDWGRMELQQNGNTVNGTYTHDQGRIQGTVSGRKLTGTWSEYPSYSPPGDAGDIVFIISEDCSSFDGTWRYGSSGGWSGNWTGARESTGSGTSYLEATLTHSGFDFSEGTPGESLVNDGEIIFWQPGAATHPDYPRDSGYLWWRNTYLDKVNYASQTKDMGAVDIATVRAVPAEWDKSPLIPPLLVGHTIVAKCYDGYVKFQVISVDPADESARVKYWYSTDTTFDEGTPTLQPTLEKTEFAKGIATPMGFAFDPDGRLFVGNRERGEVFGPITRGDNPPPVYASGLGAVADIAFDEASYLYACNDYSGNIYKVPPGGGEVHPFFTGSTFAGTEPDPNSLNIAPPAFSGSKAEPGDLIVMDRDYGSYAKRHIVAISPTGEVTLLAGPEELPAVPSDGDFSPDGRFYATTEAGTIFTLDADGVITEFGNFNLTSISSLSINPVNGDIFVGGADKIFKIDPHTKDIVVFAKDFGVVPWWSALSVSPDGKTLYVGDSNADTVYTISL